MGTMIDRPARDACAELLRHLAAGLITNYEYEDRRPRSTDLAVLEIDQFAVWPRYDDLSEHKFTGDLRLAGENRHELARCILFLKSDLEYEWPRLAGVRGLLLTMLGLLTFGAINPLFRRWFRRFGDFEAWPFRRPHDYDSSLRNPPYLRDAV